MKKIFINCVISFLVAIILFLIFEGLFRYIIPPPYRDIDVDFYDDLYIADDELGHIHKPNIKIKNVSINSLGFRGEELKEDRINIICVGDSHTFGFGVDDEETYPYQLQKLIGNKYNVINMGVLAYEHCRQIALLNRWIERLNPKIVIFGVTLTDLWVDLPATPYVKKESTSHKDPITFRSLMLKSALLTYVRNIFPGIKIKLGLVKLPAHEEYYSFWNKDEVFNLYTKNMEEEVKNLLKMNIKVILAVFPHPAEVYLMDETVRRPMKFFRTLEEVNIMAIDLKPTLQAHYKTLSTLYLEEGHPNEYAYKLVAQEVFRNLKRKKMLQIKEGEK